MTFLATLWLPIVLSAVIIFVASSVMHMLLPYHHGDYGKLPEEDNVRSALRTAGLKRGLYVFPFCTHKEMNTPAAIEKYEQGPVGMMIVFPTGRPVMPKFLGLWFGYCLIIAFFVAYLTAHTIAPGTNYLVVFRVAGTAGFLAFGLGPLANVVWKGYPWGFVLKEVIDGLIYGLLMAGTFGWLWPR
ncbi:MAG TPA: hypothetical protein VMP68_25860 [Candidatus Eisenbacteria bacterium]|nr:hypothetical protein [Candidatus Eisenbacteria bacterium]